jgi:hypothetical protein
LDIRGRTIESHVDGRKRKRARVWNTTPRQYWRDVLAYAKQNEIPFDELIDLTLQIAQRRKIGRRYPKGCINYVQIIAERLFVERGSSEEFRDEIALKIRTNNIQAVLDLIRAHLYLPGLKSNLVPSNKTVHASGINLKRFFVALLHPEKSFSGFRVNLFLYVKLAAYLLLNKEDISGLEVDIWGDACEIGGKEVTRFVFRVLSDDLPNKLSSQSANAAFSFAEYYGKCSDQ